MEFNSGGHDSLNRSFKRRADDCLQNDVQNFFHPDWVGLAERAWFETHQLKFKRKFAMLQGCTPQFCRPEIPSFELEKKWRTFRTLPLRAPCVKLLYLSSIQEDSVSVVYARGLLYLSSIQKDFYICLV
ncbi:hypothetical protein CEXT_793631 [Caerostris extrusa]|uniref:Uncharacterized protein n=1 Tax=Caerostris extrusa TaxID=172846 RepID=A0AAV4VXR4_CAEEX|nr:hypothetical protein CEXT_793631 [Caerostris extrusa]